jgi:hypothetical protein
MGLFRLRRPLSVQPLMLNTGPSTPIPGTPKVIDAGEVIESRSAPSREGRILIRYHGSSYRVWKEELLDEAIAESLTPRSHSARSPR